MSYPLTRRSLSSSSATSSSSTSTNSSSSSSSTSSSLDHTQSIEILHQLCAFEQLFQEFFATLDEIPNPPIRATFTLKYDREALFVHPTEKRKARREDDFEILQAMIKAITDSQRDDPHNLIPEFWLKSIEANFLSALSNDQLHLKPCPDFDNQAGLFARPSLRLRSSPGSRSPTILVKGIEFFLFAFPPEVGNENADELGFNPELMFDVPHHGDLRLCLGLGMARTLNHSCQHNVQWNIPRNHLDFDNGIEGVGFQSVKLVKRKGRILPGQQISASYSEGFAKTRCTCSSIRKFHDPGRQGRDPRPGKPQDASFGDSSGKTQIDTEELLSALPGLTIRSNAPVAKKRKGYRDPDSEDESEDEGGIEMDGEGVEGRKGNQALGFRKKDEGRCSKRTRTILSEDIGVSKNEFSATEDDESRRSSSADHGSPQYQSSLDVEPDASLYVDQISAVQQPFDFTSTPFEHTYDDADLDVLNSSDGDGLPDIGSDEISQKAGEEDKHEDDDNGEDDIEFLSHKMANYDGIEFIKVVQASRGSCGWCKLAK